MPKFRGPTIPFKFGRPDDLWFVSFPLSKTVVKQGGTWKTVMTPQGDYLKTCEIVLRGGYVHDISQDLADELTTAGYGDYISED